MTRIEITDEEYIEMRKELDRISLLTHKYRMTLYSVISLIYAYLLSQSQPLDPIVYLVPIPLILCFYSISLNLNFNTYYISSYLNAFPNINKYKWELLTNIMRKKSMGKYRYKLFTKNRLHGYFQYVLLLYTSLAIYFYKLIQSNNSILYKFIYSIVGLIILFFAKRLIQKINFMKYLNLMIKDWENLSSEMLTTINKYK